MVFLELVNFDISNLSGKTGWKGKRGGTNPPSCLFTPRFSALGEVGLAWPARTARGQGGCSSPGTSRSCCLKVPSDISKCCCRGSPSSSFQSFENSYAPPKHLIATIIRIYDHQFMPNTAWSSFDTHSEGSWRGTATPRLPLPMESELLGLCCRETSSLPALRGSAVSLHRLFQ